jgi:hypothetical protein
MQVLPIFADEGCWAREGGGQCDLPMRNNLGLCPEHLPEFFDARDDDGARPDFALAWIRLRAGFPPDVLLGIQSLGSYLRA